MNSCSHSVSLPPNSLGLPIIWDMIEQGSFPKPFLTLFPPPGEARAHTELSTLKGESGVLSALHAFPLWALSLLQGSLPWGLVLFFHLY